MLGFRHSKPRWLKELQAYPPLASPGIIDACIPAFFVSIAGELALSIYNGHTTMNHINTPKSASTAIYNDNKQGCKRGYYYRVNDTINSLSLGITQSIFYTISNYYFWNRVYLYIYNHYGFFKNYWIFKNVSSTTHNNKIGLKDKIASHLIMILIVDFVYYWAHRKSHEINLMWATHGIHHSSENFNLSTALRQSSFQKCAFSWIDLIPKALIGMPPQMYILHGQLNTVMVCTFFFCTFSYLCLQCI